MNEGFYRDVALAGGLTAALHEYGVFSEDVIGKEKEERLVKYLESLESAPDFNNEETEAQLIAMAKLMLVEAVDRLLATEVSE